MVHSFPTRRSSDLTPIEDAAPAYVLIESTSPPGAALRVDSIDT